MKRAIGVVGVLLVASSCSSHSTPIPAQQGYERVGTYQGVTFWQRDSSAVITTGRLGSICNGGGPRGYSRTTVCNDWTSDGGVVAAFVPATAQAARAGDVDLHLFRTSGPFAVAVAVFGAGTDPAGLVLGPVTVQR